MRRRAQTLALSSLALAAIGLVGLAFGYRTEPAASRAGAAGATVVTVTAGKPREFAFTLSRSALPWPAGARATTVTFKVRNRGAVSHRFAVCSAPVKSTRLNACKGTTTKALAPGQSATLAVTFTRRGTYEYLSTVPGQAARGMKGLIAVGVSLPETKPATTGKTTTPKTTTTTPATRTTAPAPTPSPTTPAPSPAPTPAASTGAAVWVGAGCSSCHVFSEVRGNITSSLNLTHPGPFTNGPLTPAQISALADYVNGTTGQ